MKGKVLDDALLVEQSKRGDREAFDRLVIKYQDRIFNLIYRRLGDYDRALDVAQEVFFKAYRALQSFKGRSKFYTWLFRIAINTAASAGRKRSVEKRLVSIHGNPNPGDSGRIMQIADDAPEPSKMAEISEEEQIVQEAIASLEAEYQEVILLRDIEGFSYEEVALMLECPLGSVKSRLHRARCKLRDKLKGIF